MCAGHWTWINPPRQVRRQMLVPAFSPCTSQRSNQPNSRFAIARAFPFDALLHKSRRRSIPTSISVRDRKAAAGFVHRHCDLPHLAADARWVASQQSADTDRGAWLGVPEQPCRAAAAGVVGAAAQRLCKVDLQSGFMVAAAAFSRVARGVRVESKVEGGLASRRTMSRRSLSRARPGVGWSRAKATRCIDETLLPEIAQVACEQLVAQASLQPESA